MYRYENLKPSLFTEAGVVMYTKIRDRTKKLLAEAGAARLDKMIQDATGDSWLMLACVDRMVEAEELFELTRNYPTAAQHRVFVLVEG